MGVVPHIYMPHLVGVLASCSRAHVAGVVWECVISYRVAAQALIAWCVENVVRRECADTMSNPKQ